MVGVDTRGFFRHTELIVSFAPAPVVRHGDAVHGQLLVW